MKKLLLLIFSIQLLFSCNSIPPAERAAAQAEITKSIDSIKQDTWERHREKGEEAAKGSGVEITEATVTPDDIDIPEARVYFKNNTTKIIDGIKIEIFCYNNFDEPVRGGVLDNNIFQGISQFEIKPGEILPGLWRLTSFEQTTKIKPVIKELHFTDGSKWGEN